MTTWLLLVYRIPREPTAGRVYVWRKLKQLGAVALQDAIWVLPKTPRTQEHFQWLASEIAELNGEVVLWEAAQLFATNPQALRREFTDKAELEYREILKALKSRNRDLSALSKRFLDTQSRDYFDSPLGAKTRDKLLAAGGG